MSRRWAMMNPHRPLPTGGPMTSQPEGQDVYSDVDLPLPTATPVEGEDSSGGLVALPPENVANTVELGGGGDDSAGGLDTDSAGGADEHASNGEQ